MYEWIMAASVPNWAVGCLVLICIFDILIIVLLNKWLSEERDNLAKLVGWVIEAERKMANKAVETKGDSQ